MSSDGGGACSSKREDKKRKNVDMLDYFDLKMQAEINKLEIEEAKREIKQLRRTLGEKGVELEKNTMTIQNWIQTNEQLYNNLRQAETDIKRTKESSDRLNEECNQKIVEQAREIGACKQEIKTHTDQIQKLTTENTTLRNK